MCVGYICSQSKGLVLAALGALPPSLSLSFPTIKRSYRVYHVGRVSLSTMFRSCSPATPMFNRLRPLLSAQTYVLHLTKYLLEKSLQVLRQSDRQPAIAPEIFQRGS